jgi:hypothetical protein
MSANDSLPTIRTDDELLDALGRGESVTPTELTRVLSGSRNEIRQGEQDAFDFFARELPEVNTDRSLDLVGILLNVMLVISALLMLASMVAVFVSMVVALALAWSGFALGAITLAATAWSARRK